MPNAIDEQAAELLDHVTVLDQELAENRGGGTERDEDEREACDEEQRRNHHAWRWSGSRPTARWSSDPS